MTAWLRYVAAMLIRSLVVLSLSAALLAGCGDDEPSASTPAPAEATTPKVELPTSPDVAEAETADKKAAAESAAAGTAEEKKKSGDAPSWVNQVNYRCKKHQEANNKALADFQKQGMTGPEDAAKAMDSLVPLGRQLVKDLRDVDVPGDVDGDYTKFLDSLDGAFDLMPELTKTLTSGKEDPALMKKLADVEKNTRPFADKYDLTECLTSGA